MTDTIQAKPKLITQFDSPWKSILDEYFADFLDLCWPQAYALIDWNKKPIMLDKELQSLMQDNVIGKRIADKMVKVYLRNGIEQYILLHVEVQGSKEHNFAERMYVYHYRLQDKFNQKVANVAILIDSNKNWRPSKYITEFCDSKVEMNFHVVKILDYAAKEAELKQSKNAFAAVILVQLEAIKAKSSDSKLDIKLQLIRGLFKSGRQREDIRHLLKFIDCVIVLNKEEKLRYNDELNNIDKELKMEYVPTFARDEFYKGMEQGFGQGMATGERTLLTQLLEHKFKTVPTTYTRIIQLADSQQLLMYANRVLDCDEISDVFKN